MKRKIPKRWSNYEPVGRHVEGTRFLPFKVPLKLELCKSVPEECRFTPSALMRSMPMVKAIIDLTDTNRYYNVQEFTSRGVFYRKINIRGGGVLPPISKQHEFFAVVDDLMEMFAQDRDALIGVHCTHGLNRTGYLICKYMVSRLKIDPQEAIKKFEEARGHKIEREIYLNDIVSPSATSDFKRRPSQSAKFTSDETAPSQGTNSDNHNRAQSSYNYFPNEVGASSSMTCDNRRRRDFNSRPPSHSRYKFSHDNYTSPSRRRNDGQIENWRSECRSPSRNYDTHMRPYSGNQRNRNRNN